MKLDTRSKIIPAARADEFGDAVFVAMYLDPLTATHARRLQEIATGGRRLVVLLFDPPAPLLPMAARAELAASLACVAAVMPGSDELAPVPHFDERSADLARRDALTRHVFQRHAAAAGPTESRDR